ncbi:S41 family peptidase [Clostridium sp. chh4-2]|uniref:S41 family peptidase n=1 Tax=Clostridium sp. chh4-2 TaxID=2067550 RepID=UPI000CCE0A9B|nr:S41 family peptidase [Clostridium sp. chh4-2]PNV63227.1 S41 family peptidase [Clostridium sp. chh4-2]
MENKNKFWKGALVGALVTAFTGLIVVLFSAGIFLFGRGVIDNQVQTQKVETGISSEEGTLDFKRIEDKMELIQQIIDKYYLFDEDPEKVEAGIYVGMMYGLEDPYSTYYTKEDFEKLMEDTEGVYCGIGAMVSQNRSTGIISAIRVFENSPSFEAGLLPGDILYSVDGTEVTGMDLDILVGTYIKGEEGTDVHITVLRGEAGEKVELTMTRRQVEVPTVEHQMLEDNVGYIYVLQFDTITAQQFKDAIDDLEKQGMEKLVVDLRDNPGGVLDAVVDMLDYVLPDGLLVSTADRDGKGDKYYSDDGHQVDHPMAVLVNGNSASASEVFTGAVKDFGWGTIVGTTTFGKGIVQNLIPLGDGTAIKLTTSHYFTPNGFDLHGKGIEPDVVVELDEALKSKAVIPLEEDNQLQAAIEALK